MKNIIHNLNKAFESRIRLGIMSALSVNDSLDFNSFKNLMGLTDGNLASHLKALEKEGYIVVRKVFIGRKPNTSYLATPEGIAAFKKHIEALEQLLRST